MIRIEFNQWVRQYHFQDPVTRARLVELVDRQLAPGSTSPGLSYNLHATITDGPLAVDHQDPRYSSFFEFLRLSLADWVASVLGGQTPFQFQYPSIWAVCYGPNDWADSHLHGPTCASWAYYADAPPGSPGLTFDEFGLTLPVTTGLLVIFPGWLWHSVQPCPPSFQGLRRVIAGNASIV